MRKEIKIISLLLLALCSIISCDDVFEEDIENEKVILLFPNDNDTIIGDGVSLQWNDNNEIDEFRLRVETASDQIILDTLINAISFNIDLDRGDYCWKVRGENFAFETAFSEERCFMISAPIDLSGVNINLTSPNDEITTNASSILFRWDAIENATNYDFRLLRVNNNIDEIIFQDTNLITNEIQLEDEISVDSQYRWEVKGVNTKNNTSTDIQSRIFTINTMGPEVPGLTTPTEAQAFDSGDNLSFSWSFNSSNIESNLQISSNQSFSSLELDETISDSQAQVTISESGTYFWRVRGTDALGNVGEFSAFQSFVVNDVSNNGSTPNINSTSTTNQF